MPSVEVPCGQVECRTLTPVELGTDLTAVKCRTHTPPVPCRGHEWLEITELGQRPHQMLCLVCSEARWFPTRQAAAAYTGTLPVSAEVAFFSTFYRRAYAEAIKATIGDVENWRPTGLRNSADD